MARDEWIARTSDDQIVANVTACKLALTERAHDFLTANDGPNFLRAARALSVHFPPIQRVEDVSERFEDLSDIHPARSFGSGMGASRHAPPCVSRAASLGDGHKLLPPPLNLNLNNGRPPWRPMASQARLAAYKRHKGGILVLSEGEHPAPAAQLAPALDHHTRPPFRRITSRRLYRPPCLRIRNVHHHHGRHAVFLP